MAYSISRGLRGGLAGAGAGLAAGPVGAIAGGVAGLISGFGPEEEQQKPTNKWDSYLYPYLMELSSHKADQATQGATLRARNAMEDQLDYVRGNTSIGRNAAAVMKVSDKIREGYGDTIADVNSRASQERTSRLGQVAQIAANRSDAQFQREAYLNQQEGNDPLETIVSEAAGTVAGAAVTYGLNQVFPQPPADVVDPVMPEAPPITGSFEPPVPDIQIPGYGNIPGNLPSYQGIDFMDYFGMGQPANAPRQRQQSWGRQPMYGAGAR